MAVLFTMLLLVLGYYYARGLPSEKVNLKRSAGWETYVYLGFHGLRFLITALTIAVVLWVLIIVALWLLDFFFDWPLRIYLQRMVTWVVFDDIQVYHLFIAVFTWALCQSEIDKKLRQGNTLVFENIKNYDGLLQMVIEAAADQKILRLSLKSRKVYVGLVMEEQFEAGDLDYVLIIPLISGYRDKDTLDIFFDCNYASVYEKFARDDLSAEAMVQVEDFRLAVKASEIESVSFFDFNLYDEFERYKKPTDNVIDKSAE